MTRNPIPNANSRDIAAIDLDRVLARLKHKILSSEADPRLQHSSYERTKTSANLEYARTLLLRLEHDSSNIKIQSRKAAAQTSLSSHRALIKRLTDRLHDLDRTGDDDDILYGPPDEEDILSEATIPPSAPTTTRNAETPPIPPTQPNEPTSHLRNRFQSTPAPLHPSPTQPPDLPPPTLLETNDTETATLTTSLVLLAQALKTSSTHFSDSLALDTETLNRATEGLDKNSTGMEAAGRRMGLLKRMSEGKGWWGRMMLYAWIGGLWVLAVGLVFVGPKLRF